MNEEEMREAEAKEVDYCLNTMKTCRFWAPPGVMGALFHCPFCGPITESRFDPERAHIWNMPPRLVKILEGVVPDLLEACEDARTHLHLLVAEGILEYVNTEKLDAAIAALGKARGDSGR